MRKLVVVRGCPGSRKSSFILNDLGLAGHVLSSDDLRAVLGSPMMTPTGAMILPQDQNGRVMAMLRDILRERMERGETLAVDMVQESLSDLKPYLELAHKHRYETLIVDFGAVPLERALADNLRRTEYKVVPSTTVERMYAMIAATPTLKAVRERANDPDSIFSASAAAPTVVEWSADGSHVDAAKSWLAVPMRDLSRYREVVHVGDLQGCHTVVAGPEGPYFQGLDDDRFHIFVGDFCDRGVENGKVMRWMLDEVVGRDNVALIRGNHETHLERWADGLPSVSEEFSERTLPQLHADGITREDVGRLVDTLDECLFYRWNDQKVMVTHAGLPTTPARPELISSRQYTHGAGPFEDPVDTRFSEIAPRDWIQVHGHRNARDLPPQASSRSFNLEGKIEFGGELRLAVLSESGWRTESYANRVFGAPPKPRSRDVATMPEWMLRETRAPAKLSPETVTALRAHKGVNERTASKSGPHVVSFGFSKSVFYDRTWDDVVVKARGLFMQRDSFEIVARSYDKFFNLGERPETEFDTLMVTLQFPVVAYLKENGFLGILGYDSSTDSLFSSSKTFAEGDFADLFRKHLDATLAKEKQERLKRWLRENEAGMSFEVIDPVADPHIVPYDAAKIVLLDVLHRSESGERASYEKTATIAAKFGLEAKEMVARFKSKEALAGFLRRVDSLEYRYRGRPIEGFVIEDARGFQFKVKSPFYAFWKQLRGQVGRIVSHRNKGTQWKVPDIATLADPALAREFLEWADQQDTETLQRSSITALREEFEKCAVAPAP